MSLFQNNIFCSDPEELSVSTEVIAIERYRFGCAIALKTNPVLASRDNRPSDRGLIRIPEGRSIHFLTAKAVSDLIWLIFEGCGDEIEVGTRISVEVNHEFRERLSRLETAVHMFNASGNELFEKFHSIFEEISHDANSAVIVSDINCAVFPFARIDIDKKM